MSLTYDFENRRIEDGERALGVEGTFRIHNTVYVLSEAAHAALLDAFSLHDYVVENSEGKDPYRAERSHEIAPDEILDELGVKSVAFPTSFIVDTRYQDGHKHSLTEPDIHKTILGSASQVADLSYYSRDGDMFDGDIITRMSAFVKNLVDADYGTWQKLVAEARSLHAQDFIKSIAAWASGNSDRKTRKVRMDSYGSYLTVEPNEKFAQRPPAHGFYYRY